MSDTPADPPPLSVTELYRKGHEDAVILMSAMQQGAFDIVQSTVDEQIAEPRPIIAGLVALCVNIMRGVRENQDEVDELWRIVAMDEYVRLHGLQDPHDPGTV